MKTRKLCCKEFDEAIEKGKIEQFKDGECGKPEWNIPGCCGGGCFVLIDIKHCPWCGYKLRENYLTTDR